MVEVAVMGGAATEVATLAEAGMARASLGTEGVDMAAVRMAEANPVGVA